MKNQPNIEKSKPRIARPDLVEPNSLDAELARLIAAAMKLGHGEDSQWTN